MHRILVTLAALLPFTIAAQLTVQDMFNPKFHSEGVHGLTHMQDGEHYCVMEDDDQGHQKIVVYDYKKGTATEVIFNTGWFVLDEGKVSIDGFSFSADEKKLLIETKNKSIYRWSYTSDYQIFDRDSRSMSDLHNGSQMYATFSPDGNKIAFVQGNDIYYKDVPSGRLKQVTTDGLKNHIINGASDWVYEEELEITRAYEWSPDSRKIAYLRFDESAVKEWVMPVGSSTYPELYTFKYPKAGEENADVTLRVFSLDNGQTSSFDLDPGGDHYLPRIKWTRDASMLTVQRLNRHQNHLELLAVNITTGDIKTLIDETDKYYISIHDNLHFLSDNTFIWTSERDGYNHIYHYASNGSLISQLTSGQWEVKSVYGVDEKKRVIHYQSTELSPLERHVFTIGLNGKGKSIAKETAGTWHAEFSKSFAWCIMRHGNVTTPSRVSVMNQRMKEVRVMKDNSGMKEVWSENGMTSRSFFTFKTDGDVELNGWMLKPNDFDPTKKYPVLMFVYGGPGSQMVLNNWGGPQEVWFQMLTQNGYIIACVDNRGTGSRGAEFKKMTYLNLGKYEAIDQINAAKYLGTLGYVDKNRIGIFGWSYGGYMSSLCLMLGNEVFKMAIAVAPVTHWKYYDTIYTERFMRTPQENPDGYDGWAPTEHADKLNGKLLLVHGSADDNVHAQNSMELVNALVASNKQFSQFMYPDKNHGITGKATRTHLYTMMTEFVLTNL